MSKRRSGDVPQPTVAWHYTVGVCWKCIRTNGFLKCATAFVSDDVRHCVWLTTEDVEFEPTATKATMSQCGRYTIALTVRETEWLGQGLVRVGVAVADVPDTWRDYRRLSGDSPKMLRVAQDIARRKGSNFYKWHVSWEVIPRSKWVSVQVFDEAGWRDLAADEEPKCRASTPKPAMTSRRSDPSVTATSDVLDFAGDLAFRDDVVSARRGRG